MSAGIEASNLGLAPDGEEAQIIFRGFMREHYNKERNDRETFLAPHLEGRALTSASR